MVRCPCAPTDPPGVRAEKCLFCSYSVYGTAALIKLLFRFLTCP